MSDNCRPLRMALLAPASLSEKQTNAAKTHLRSLPCDTVIKLFDAGAICVICWAKIFEAPNNKPRFCIECARNQVESC